MKPLKNILYVEDEADIRAIARVSLEDIGGFNVKFCNSGIEALAAIETFSPDLLLLDVMMPGMDGPATLAKLKTIPSLRKTPFIFMTAKVQTAEVNEYLNLGALDVISKPFDAMTLSDDIKKNWRKFHE